jgi:DNA-binding NtrC family response regulator
MPATVLIVEDSEILRTLTADAISILGMKTLECGSADEAIHLLADHHIDLMITDVRMPGSMDGLELAQTVWKRWPGFPVIITSGNVVVSSGTLPERSVYLPKPYTLDSLHKVLKLLVTSY